MQVHGIGWVRYVSICSRSPKSRCYNIQCFIIKKSKTNESCEQWWQDTHSLVYCRVFTFQNKVPWSDCCCALGLSKLNWTELKISVGWRWSGAVEPFPVIIFKSNSSTITSNMQVCASCRNFEANCKTNYWRLSKPKFQHSLSTTKCNIWKWQTADFLLGLSQSFSELILESCTRVPNFTHTGGTMYAESFCTVHMPDP